jgi:formylglycine-generating enzyme required for sulfatase activity
VTGISAEDAEAYAEWTRHPHSPKRYVIRGGSYFHDSKTAQVSNRAVTVSTLRDPTLGLRLCASITR